MFIEIEGNDLINLARITRVSMIPHKKVAALYDGAVLVAESAIAYAYFVNPENRKTLYVPLTQWESKPFAEKLATA